MRIAPLAEGTFLVPEDHALYDAASDKSECAALVQAFGLPNTNQWRRGPRVQDVAILAPGTVIATLGSGVYLSDYSGKSHVGIFLAKTARGIVMLDQYRGGGGKLGIRTKYFGARHEISPVPLSRLIDSSYSYRTPIVDTNGDTTYVQDQRLATVRTRVNLTGDGGEYYILLGDGHVARHDSPNVLRRSKAENREVAHALVTELFAGTDIAGDARRSGEELRRALEDLKPAPAAPSP
jgi:hypothetical protein